MRKVIVTAVLVAAVGAPGVARADTHGWFGQLGPVGVRVWLFGFAEGAHAAGWTEGEASAFADWAARLGASLPAGVGVEIDQTTETDEKVVVTLLRCRAGDRRCTRPVSRRELSTPRLGKDVELDTRFATRILRAVGKATGRKLRLQAAESPPLYTIQLLAARSQQRADAFARRLDEAYVHSGTYVVEANCGPCGNPPEARQEDDQVAGADIHRVLVGNYESPRMAREDLAELARLGYDGAFVRPLGPGVRGGGYR